MTYFVLFPDVILVSGALNSLLIDFRVHNYISIDNEIANFLIPRTIELNNLNPDDKEFLDYLEEKEYGVYCNKIEMESFQPINEEWDFPAEITNAILEIDTKQQVDLNLICKQLSALQCEQIELRMNEKISNQQFENIIALMGENGIHGIQLVLPFDSALTSEYLFKMGKNCNVFIYSVLMYNTPQNFTPPKTNNVITFDYRIGSLTCLDCGNISKTKFLVDIPFYAESIKHNTCLNRKIAISTTGEIKNCPSFKNSFGNVNKISLKNVLNNSNFTDIWHINKEQIKVCKDCEFRRICTDCRAYTVDEADIYSKPKKCNYNPYKGVWEDSINEQK